MVFVYIVETSKAFTQLHVDRQYGVRSEHGDDEDDIYENSDGEKDIKERLESVGDDVDTLEHSGAPPSPKKRKAVSQHGVAIENTYSLADILAQFGDIQLNKDFYDSIEKTESRCDLGSCSVRENDRKAFSAAFVRIQDCIREAVETGDHCGEDIFGDEMDSIEHRGRVLKALRLITMSLEVIQFLVDLGGGTSVSASLTLEGTDSVARSLSKSTSQHVNIQDKGKQSASYTSDVDEGMSPLKHSYMPHGKHPRQRHQEEPKETSQPSERVSLISNEHPKRQRKDEDEASSKRPAAVDLLGEHVNDSTSAKSASHNVSIQEEHIPQTSTQTSSRTHEKSGDVEQTAKKNASLDSNLAGSKQEKQDAHGSGRKSPGGWGSSLVCADLSLSEVGSKLYWPFVSSLKASGILDVSKIPEKASFETIFAACSDMNEGSKDLADRIYDSVESIYREFDVQANTAQKAISIVVAAFERILSSYVQDMSITG